MKLYLSGPMTGLPELNFPMFNLVATDMRAQGHIVYNPADWRDPAEPKFNIRKAFAAYCKFICEEADGILMLPGWQNSLGATCEHSLALNCGLDVLFFGKVQSTKSTASSFQCKHGARHNMCTVCNPCV